MNNNDDGGDGGDLKSKKLRVEFSVGSEKDGRWVTFGEDLELNGIAEWFRFTGEAISRMFNAGPSAVEVRMVTPNNNKKIETIKTVRTFTGSGLKTAKDAVEMLYGGLLGAFEDGTRGHEYAAELRKHGNVVRVTQVMFPGVGNMPTGFAADLYVCAGAGKVLTSPDPVAGDILMGTTHGAHCHSFVVHHGRLCGTMRHTALHKKDAPENEHHGCEGSPAGHRAR